MRLRIPYTPILLALLAIGLGSPGHAEAIFLRFRVNQPVGQNMEVRVTGFRHKGNWYLPVLKNTATSGAWTDWINLSDWPWDARDDRAGGVAEWPSMKLMVMGPWGALPREGTSIDVQLADSPREDAVVLNFNEKSVSNSIGFLVPHPLREHRDEFETGTQMTARHYAWAQAATGNQPIQLRHFQEVTSLWGPYDPGLARQDISTLTMLGFNVLHGADPLLIRDGGAKMYTASFLYGPDPDVVRDEWKKWAGTRIEQGVKTEWGKWEYSNLTHWTISDEVSTVSFDKVDPAKVNGWFHDYLRDRGVTDRDIGQAIDAVAYPTAAMKAGKLPRDADLPTRRLLYYAAKFGQWWSARQLRLCTDLIQGTLPNVPTETLPTDHGFFYAWGPPYMGMSYRLLDLFEVGRQRSVDQLSAEDWMGLNHMYGPNYTWSGAQSFAYFNALLRSARADQPIMQRALITPSDDAYLRLKAYSALGQGAKSFYFWTYGPTYIGTENYWSDLRSEYEGIAKLHRALQKSEELLYPAQPVRDPVAILYSVSHDLWHTDDPEEFVEKRLLWHAVRHLQVQPDFLSEEDVEAGKLKSYKVLYLTDWALTRGASAAIDRWVRNGGVLYLSAGAATRDEFYEPYLPPFAAAVWPPDAATRFTHQPNHRYNERIDLSEIKPLTSVTTRQGNLQGMLSALGARLDMKATAGATLAAFADGSPAGATIPYGRGRIYAFGFLPMLAYGQLAGFKRTTLEEKWPALPRELVRLPLQAAGITPVAGANTPVVETSLLEGPHGAVVVLANYTYQPLGRLSLDVKLSQSAARAISTEGSEVRLTRTPTGVRLELPLDWTDIVLLPRN